MKPNFDWQHKFTHAGESIYVTGKVLSASGERAISGAVRTDDYARAEIALLANTVRTVKVNEKMAFNQDKKGRGSSDIPSSYDRETGKTTAEVLLEYIVTHIAPHLAEQYEDAFGPYYQGESDEPELGLEEADLAEKPTARLSPVLTESLGGEGT